MESRTQRQGTLDRAAGRGTTTSNRDLRIRDVMSKEVVTTMPGDNVFDTAKRMSEAGISCLVVMDGERVVGILSERDVLREHTEFDQATSRRYAPEVQQQWYERVVKELNEHKKTTKY